MTSETHDDREPGRSPAGAPGRDVHEAVQGHSHAGGLAHHHGGVDPAIATSKRGMWALRWSFVGLFATAVLQAFVFLRSSSVGLLADSIHNFGDAATALPLWVAFALSRRRPSNRFPYGLGRVEDLAGVAIVAVILASAASAGYESIHRLFHPVTVTHLSAVMIASVIGFLGNEGAAIFRIRVGKEIGSAALVADGYHARTDGFASLAVLFGALGVKLGYPHADPIVGLLITAIILKVVWDSVISIFTRMLDGVDPGIVPEIRGIVGRTGGVFTVGEVRARWIGHRLVAEVTLGVAPDLTVAEGHDVARRAQANIRTEMPHLRDVIVHVDPSDETGDEHHRVERGGPEPGRGQASPGEE